jgi:hypothetical protein
MHMIKVGAAGLRVRFLDFTYRVGQNNQRQLIDGPSVWSPHKHSQIVIGKTGRVLPDSLTVVFDWVRESGQMNQTNIGCESENEKE